MVLLIVVLGVFASEYHAMNQRITQTYKFDWAVQSIAIFLKHNNGNSPRNWDDLREPFRNSSESGACPWTFDEIRSSVQVNFNTALTLDGSEPFVSATEVNDQYIHTRNDELRNIARVLKNLERNSN